TNTVNISVTPGTVLGMAGIGSGRYGLALGSNSTLNCQGLADDPVRLVAYNLVQESTPANWYATQNGMFAQVLGGAGGFQCRFTEWYSPAQDFKFLYEYLNVTLHFQDSLFHGGQFLA